MRNRVGGISGGLAMQTAGTCSCPSPWPPWTRSASWPAPAGIRTRCAWRQTGRCGHSGATAMGSWAMAALRMALCPAVSRPCRYLSLYLAHGLSLIVPNAPYCLAKVLRPHVPSILRIAPVPLASRSHTSIGRIYMMYALLIYNAENAYVQQQD